MIKLSDYVFDYLADYGVEDVFMLSGGGCMHLVNSLGKNKRISYKCCLFEQAVSLAKKYILRIKDDSAKGIQKTLAMLVRRGYPWDIASHACSEALRELKSEMESF